jgi:cytoskeleton protein RodZ
MAAEAGGDLRAGIGTRLRAAREKKGLTVLQAAEKIHVDPRILESLEAEDFAALGAAVYVKGHMRHYAELVGEQPAELQELYTNSTRAAPARPDLTHIPRGLPESDPRKLAGPAVVVIVAVAAIGVFWWLLNVPSEKPQPTKVQESAQSSAAPTAESEAPPEPPTPAPAQQGLGAKRAAPPKSTVSAAVAATATPGTGKNASVSSSEGAAATPPPAAVRAVASTESSSSAPPPTRAKQGELTLKFSSDSWAEVYDASGQRLFYDVGAASSAHTVKGAAPMRVVLGNASGVALEFNGRPAPIPSAVMPDGSVRFVINAHGRAVLATEGN